MIWWPAPPLRLAWYIAVSALSTSWSEISSPGTGERHPDAGRDRELGLAQQERGSERPVDAPGQGLDVGRAVQVLAQEHELVSGDPGQGVARPDQPREPVGDGEQQLVADVMAVGVVDLLEPVEVGEEDRGVGVRALGAQGGVLEPLLQQQPVRQSGQRVVQCDVVEAIRDRHDLFAPAR